MINVFDILGRQRVVTRRTGLSVCVILFTKGCKKSSRKSLNLESSPFPLLCRTTRRAKVLVNQKHKLSQFHLLSSSLIKGLVFWDHKHLDLKIGPLIALLYPHLVCLFISCRLCIMQSIFSSGFCSLRLFAHCCTSMQIPWWIKPRCRRRNARGSPWRAGLWPPLSSNKYSQLWACQLFLLLQPESTAMQRTLSSNYTPQN